jgi:hypothetical protein
VNAICFGARNGVVKFGDPSAAERAVLDNRGWMGKRGTAAGTPIVRTGAVKKERRQGGTAMGTKFVWFAGWRRVGKFG